MTWRDIGFFVLVFAVLMVVLSALAPTVGRHLDEFDFIHGLIVAGTATIVRAVRECRP